MHNADLPPMYASAKYRLVLEKKSAKLSQQKLSEFIREVMKKFGGSMLLSSAMVILGEDNTVEIRADEKTMPIAEGALLLCGAYKEMRCCFQSISDKHSTAQ